MKFYDCFTFFNELDILEIRLNELHEVVDYFVLVESRFSFNNNPKPLLFEENKDRFAKFQDKIIHIVIDKFEEDTDSPRSDGLHHNWTREEEQRRRIIEGLGTIQPEDLISVSDVDEILSHQFVEHVRSVGIPRDTILRTALIHYKYKLNYLKNGNNKTLKEIEQPFKTMLEPFGHHNAFAWQAVSLCNAETLRVHCENNPHLIRAYGKRLKTAPKDIKFNFISSLLNGWHFCSMNNVLYKLRNFSHSNELEKLTDEQLLDITQKDESECSFVEICNDKFQFYPDFIVKNKTKFDDLGWTVNKKIMEHYYQNIDGWFTFPRLYNMFVERMNDDGKIAEVGVWKGKSICYLGVTIKNSKKSITAYAIDTWEKMEKEKYQKDEDFENDIMYISFIENISNISDIVVPKRGTSVEICKEFPDQYFDVVFIDACHDYESVKEDILCWLPKVKSDGIIAGHDYEFPSVKRAVLEIFATHTVKTQEQCWWIDLSETK